MPQPLSALERSILDWLVEYVRRHTYQPSIREIGAQFDIKSTKTVSEYLQSLADKGWISRDASRSRGVRLLGLDLGADIVSVPHIDVHLSDPSLDDPLDTLTIDRRLAPSAACFFISMADDSMVDAGILEGDLLLIEPVAADEIEDDDLVLARLDGETAVRRFRRKGDTVVLEAAGATLAPVRISADAELVVMGRVGSVMRRLAGERRPDEGGRKRRGRRAGEGAVAT